MIVIYHTGFPLYLISGNFQGLSRRGGVVLERDKKGMCQAFIFNIAKERRVYSNWVRSETHYFLCKTSSANDYQPKFIKIYIMKHYSEKKFIGNMSYETLSFKKCT